MPTGTILRFLLLITAGLATLILAIPMFFSLKNTFLDLVSDIPLWKRYLLTMGVATASMIAGHLLVIANQVIRSLGILMEKLLLIFSSFKKAPPVVVSVIRATEILLAMVIDKIAFEEEQKPHDTLRVALHTLGAVLVLVGVSLMAASQQIQDKIDNCQTPIEQAEANDVEKETLRKNDDSFAII